MMVEVSSTKENFNLVSLKERLLMTIKIEGTSSYALTVEDRHVKERWKHRLKEKLLTN